MAASLIQKIIITKDINGVPSYGLPPAVEVGNVRTTLAAAVAQSTVVPNSATCVIYTVTPGASVWIQEGGASISLPAGAFATSRAELNPQMRNCTPGATLRFISGAIADVQVRFFYGNT